MFDPEFLLYANKKFLFYSWAIEMKKNLFQKEVFSYVTSMRQIKEFIFIACCFLSISIHNEIRCLLVVFRLFIQYYFITHLSGWSKESRNNGKIGVMCACNY